MRLFQPYGRPLRSWGLPVRVDRRCMQCVAREGGVGGGWDGVGLGGAEKGEARRRRGRLKSGGQGRKDGAGSVWACCGLSVVWCGLGVA